MRLAGAQLWGILINQIKDIVLGSHGMLLSSGGTLNEMEQQEGGSSSIPGEIRGPVFGNVGLLRPNRRGKIQHLLSAVCRTLF